MRNIPRVAAITQARVLGRININRQTVDRTVKKLTDVSILLFLAMVTFR